MPPPCRGVSALTENPFYVLFLISQRLSSKREGNGGLVTLSQRTVGAVVQFIIGRKLPLVQPVRFAKLFALLH